MRKEIIRKIQSIDKKFSSCKLMGFKMIWNKLKIIDSQSLSQYDEEKLNNLIENDLDFISYIMIYYWHRLYVPIFISLFLFSFLNYWVEDMLSNSILIVIPMLYFVFCFYAIYIILKGYDKVTDAYRELTHEDYERMGVPEGAML